MEGARALSVEAQALGSRLCERQAPGRWVRPAEELPQQREGGGHRGLLRHVEPVHAESVVEAEALVDGEDVDELYAFTLRHSAEQLVHSPKLCAPDGLCERIPLGDVPRGIAVARHVVAYVSK